MREYIFHGKCRDEDKWVEGCLIHYGDYCCILQDEDKLHPIDVPYLNDLGCIDGYATPVVPESVGQYTGMNDKNGRKIFEGDIIRLDEYVKSTFDINDGVVKYGWGGFYIGDFSTLNSLNALATFDGVLRGEVIGNVFENADLLEG